MSNSALKFSFYSLKSCIIILTSMERFFRHKRVKRTQISGGETWAEGGFSDVPHTWYDSIMDRKRKLYTLKIKIFYFI